MRKNNIFTLLAGVAACMLLTVGCDDKIPKVADFKEIGVTSLALNEELSNGLTLETGTSTNIGSKVILTPENATDRAESFYSSNVGVATVNGRGQLTANTSGTSDILITVGGKSVEFKLTVVDKIIIPATDVELVIPSLELMTGIEYNLSYQVRLTPEDANDGLTYSSSNPEIVSADENGILTGVSVGDATVTVASKNDQTVKATLPVTVTAFSGDYPRGLWTAEVSQDLFVQNPSDPTNLITGAFDGNDGTMLALVMPNKKLNGVSGGTEIYFIIDMKKSQPVDYFRIRHRSGLERLRYFMFEEIFGSDDGENFTSIAKDVTVTNAATAQESPNIAIPLSEYRYLKFYCKKDACFMPNGTGSSAAMLEIWLGVSE